MEHTIQEVWESNSEALEVISRYLVHYPTFITKEAAEEISKSCKVSKEYAFFVLLCAICGIQEQRSEKELVLAREYLLPGVHRLDVKHYKENPYYKKIQIPEKKAGNWEFRKESYAPYEGFVCNELVVKEDYREIPQIGFFEEPFFFPAVLEENNEWMTITPNEMETMQPVIDEVSGKVVTFGLGLGYFAFMASEKQQVTSVTVVERNPQVIRLVEEYLLCQFPHKEKIKIVCEDAFSYASTMEKEQYDYAFVDLWHNVTDGVPLYKKMKRIEAKSVGTRYRYWIEESLLSNLRWKVMQILVEGEGDNEIKRYLEKNKMLTGNEIEYCLSKEALRKMAEEL